MPLPHRFRDRETEALTYRLLQDYGAEALEGTDQVRQTRNYPDRIEVLHGVQDLVVDDYSFRIVGREVARHDQLEVGMAF